MGNENPSSPLNPSQVPHTSQTRFTKFAPARINYLAISKKVISCSRVRLAMDLKARNFFLRTKAKLLSEFLNHEVTKEIQVGPHASNTSNTLGGYGNLFSYIGFYQNEDPIEPITNYITKYPFFARVTAFKIRKGLSLSFYKVSFPNMKTIENLSPLPWESGNSWVRGIEGGISGYSNYMYRVFILGRSGMGVQSQNKQDGALSFLPKEYLPSMISKIIN